MCLYTEIIFWWRVAKWGPASSPVFRKLGDVETHPPLKRHRPQPVGATKRPVGIPNKHFRVELTDAVEDLNERDLHVVLPLLILLLLLPICSFYKSV